MSSPENTFPPGFPPKFPPTNLIWYPSTCPGSVFSPTITPSLGQQKQQDEYLLLFTPGNPGMIGYYRSFLSRLSVLLREGKETKAVSILGISHAGFYFQDCDEVGKLAEREPRKGFLEEKAKVWGYTDWKSHPQPWTLQQQSKMKAELLNWIGEWYRRQPGERKLNVLLAAHSMGAWVSMEMVKSLRSNDRLVDRTGQEEWGIRSTLDVLGGTLMFPSIMDIAKSKNGRVVTPMLSLHRSVPHPCQLFVSFLFHVILSASLGRWLVGIFTGFSALSSTSASPDGSISTTNEALDATFSFLTAPGAVEQSLYMAREEMHMIKEDTWDDEIWGIEGELEWVLYFGQGDDWVCDESRDRLIKNRGRRYLAGMESAPSASTSVRRDVKGNVLRRNKIEEAGIDVELDSVAKGADKKWKPLMIVCEEGIPHGFCIKHGEVMAEKVAIWIENIIERSGKRRRGERI
ncbi:hypothetical protein BGX38DRAFT_1228709 [Terfezia claveryi]|nr:hypothetical protein BGX38DRAFT_1228709 [Terfezia claveryi]